MAVIALLEMKDGRKHVGYTIEQLGNQNMRTWKPEKGRRVIATFHAHEKARYAAQALMEEYLRQEVNGTRMNKDVEAIVTENLEQMLRPFAAWEIPFTRIDDTATWGDLDHPLRTFAKRFYNLRTYQNGAQKQ